MQPLKIFKCRNDYIHILVDFGAERIAWVGDRLCKEMRKLIPIITPKCSFIFCQIGVNL